MEKYLKGALGWKGEDGFDPIIETSKTGKVTTLTITDAEGTKTVTINDGEDGATANIIDSATLSDNTKQTYSGKIVDQKLGDKANISDIKDNLTSTDTNKPLSANQGKVLNDTKMTNPVVLYENTGENVSTIEFNENITNFNYLEIFYGYYDDDTHAIGNITSTKTIVRNDIIYLTSTSAGDYQRPVYIHSQGYEISISDNCMYLDLGQGYCFRSDGSITVSQSAIKIFKILGYK